MVSQIHTMTELLLGNPPSETQKYVLIALGLILAYVLFDRMSRTLDIGRAQPATVLILVALGGFVIVLSMALTSEYILGNVHPRFHNLVVFLSPVVGSLVVTVPVMCLVLKANYISTSISWSVSVVVTGMLIILIRVGTDAVTTGQVSLESTIDRKEEVEQFLGNQ